jgi:hypothetical protein
MKERGNLFVLEPLLEAPFRNLAHDIYRGRRPSWSRHSGKCYFLRETNILSGFATRWVRDMGHYRITTVDGAEWLPSKN